MGKKEVPVKLIMLLTLLEYKKVNYDDEKIAKILNIYLYTLKKYKKLVKLYLFEVREILKKLVNLYLNEVKETLKKITRRKL